MLSYPKQAIPPSSPSAARPGFTLVELLVAMTVIAILAGMLTVVIRSAFTRANEFAIQQEMTQLEGAIEKFKTEFGFYPPSFKQFDLEQPDIAGDVDLQKEKFLAYLNLISPNHSELTNYDPLIDETYFDLWWTNVGSIMASSDNTSQGYLNGEDLVFWLSGINKNKQYPLTNGSSVVAELQAHNLGVVPKQEFFDFKKERLQVDPSAGLRARYVQARGPKFPYLYLDARSYPPVDPTDANATDGAYCGPGTVIENVIDAKVHLNASSPNPNNVTAAQSLAIFNQIYPNNTTFQIVTFGLDGVAQDPDIQAPANPNAYNLVGVEGLDNIVNFTPSGPNKLETIALTGQ